MSLEFYAFLPAGAAPDRDTWQAALDAAGLPLTLDPEFEPALAQGFCPMTLNGEDSGCEIDWNMDSLDELTEASPELAAAGLEGSTVLSYRIGGDMAGLACVAGSAAALVQASGARFYDPAEGEFLDADALLHLFKTTLAEI